MSENFLNIWFVSFERGFWIWGAKLIVNIVQFISSHIFVFWYLVDSYQKTKISAVNFFKFTFCWENKFFICQSTKNFSVKTGFEKLKKSKQTWRLIFWSFGSYLPKTKRQKYEMNCSVAAESYCNLGYVIPTLHA